MTRATVRAGDLSGPDAAVVSALLARYHAQTEAEKIEHGLVAAGPLPQRYQREIDDPASVFTGATVLLADVDGVSVGMLVAHQTSPGLEVKRLWVEPAARGDGAASALLAAAGAMADGVVRLSVWNWRADALGLYRARGFREVASWESRPQLVCLERDSATAPG